MLVAWLLLLQTSTLVQVTPDTFGQAREPQIAIGSDDKVYVAYGMGDAVYLSTSDDKGATYSDPLKVGESGVLSLGMRRGPRIGVHEGVITITAIYGAQGRGRDGDIVAFRSADAGKTWSTPVRVNDVEGAGREGLHAMAVSPDGTVACTWLDMRDAGTKLYLAASKDGGATWSEDRLIYASPSGSICECCHPSLDFGTDGTLHIMFRNSLEGARDMYSVTSRDLRTFTSPIKLGQGTWMLNACPMDGGMLAAGGAGTLESIWRRETSLFRTTVTGEEVALGEGRNPWIAQAASGTYLVWQRGREVVYSGPGMGAKRISSQGEDPVVAASPDGSFVIAAWNEDGVRAIRL